MSATNVGQSMPFARPRAKGHSRPQAPLGSRSPKGRLTPQARRIREDQHAREVQQVQEVQEVQQPAIKRSPQAKFVLRPIAVAGIAWIILLLTLLPNHLVKPDIWVVIGLYLALLWSRPREAGL